MTDKKPMTRESLIEGLMAKGKTREQAEAFLDLLGSAFRAKGWAPGKPLKSEEISEKLDVFIGEREKRTPTTDMDCRNCEDGDAGEGHHTEDAFCPVGKCEPGCEFIAPHIGDCGTYPASIKEPM